MKILTKYLICGGREEYQVNDKGENDGYFKSFHSNGRINFCLNYRNGNVYGVFKTYHYSGQIWMMDQNKNGNNHGIEMEFIY